MSSKEYAKLLDSLPKTADDFPVLPGMILYFLDNAFLSKPVCYLFVESVHRNGRFSTSHKEMDGLVNRIAGQTKVPCFSTENKAQEYRTRLLSAESKEAK